MKKTISVMLMLVLIIFGSVGIVRANSYTEVFLGTKLDNIGFQMQDDYRATFGFNLTALGDKARLYDETETLIGSPVLPTLDATGFTTPSNIMSAWLSVSISATDNAEEFVRIRAILSGGDRQTLYQTAVQVGNSGTRQYATWNLNLIDEGMINELSDGKFISLVLSPDRDNAPNNDFRIDQVRLAVVTPEPTTMLLLGLGLLGVAGIRRFKK